MLFRSNAKAIQYARVPVSRLHVLSCLTHNGPVIFGCSVFQSIYDPSVASTGYIQKPSPTDAPIGGHAMLIVGYEPSTDRFIVRNSWGEGWGDSLAAGAGGNSWGLGSIFGWRVLVGLPFSCLRYGFCCRVKGWVLGFSGCRGGILCGVKR